MESSLPSTQILDSDGSAERKNEAKNYNEVMSTLPKVKGLNGTIPSPWKESCLFKSASILNPLIYLSPVFQKRAQLGLRPSLLLFLLTKMPHDCVPFLEYDLAQDPSNRDLAIPLLSTHVPYSCLPCWAISKTQTHTIYVIRQLAYSTELLSCINYSKKQYNNKRRR